LWIAEDKMTNKKSEKKVVTIKQVKSGIGRGAKQIGTLKGLKLGKINRVSELEDTDSVRGMINSVSHLIEIVSK
jgi:large subunit ribosomal protein L30